MEEKTFYFVTKDCHSYTLEEIVKHNLNLGIGSNIPIESPNGTQIGSMYLNLDLKKKMMEELQNSIKCGYLIVDQSRTAGDQICSISQDEYQNPYLLKCNGRSYERDSIVQAIEKSLYEDQPLRLEDVVLLPEMLKDPYGRITLYPNQSLGSLDTEPIKFDYSLVKQKPFDKFLAHSRNIPTFSDFLKNITPNRNGMWDYEKLWAEYAKHRELDTNWANTAVPIENLIITDQKIPNIHPKCDTGHIIFKNIIFKNCTIDVMACWCGFDIRSSYFKDCTLIFPKIIAEQYPNYKGPNIDRKIVNSIQKGCTLEYKEGYFH